MLKLGYLDIMAAMFVPVEKKVNMAVTKETIGIHFGFDGTN